MCKKYFAILSAVSLQKVFCDSFGDVLEESFCRAFCKKLARVQRRVALVAARRLRNSFSLPKRHERVNFGPRRGAKEGKHTSGGFPSEAISVCFTVE